MSFLGSYFDSGLEIPGDTTKDGLTAVEIERLTVMLSTVVVSSTIPRRLGGDATDRDLALDRKRARRVGHATQKSVSQWVDKLTALELHDSPEIRQAGAQLEWVKFREEHPVVVQNRQRYLATWAILFGEERWGKTAIVRLNNELSWVGYALRD